MIINKRKFIDYSVFTLFIAMSGVPSFHFKILTVLEFSILLFIFILRKKSFDVKFLWFFVLLVVVTLLQAFKFQLFPIVTNLGLLLMVFSAYMIVKILGNKFISYYVNILYYMAIVSFVFYFSILLIPSVASLIPVKQSILIYNFNVYVWNSSIVRNSGPFWEPGAFAGYLIIAFIFNFLKEVNIVNKKNIVLFIAIVTTLSTTTYLALFVFFFFIYYNKIKNIFFKAATVIIIVLAGVYAYTTFDFLGKKIESQLEVAQTMGIQKSDNTQRFLNILRDMKDFKGHELIGRGGSDETRYDLAPADEFVIRTVGLTDILTRVGVFVFIVMFYFLFKSICVYLEYLQEQKQMYCFGIFIAILITLMSEVYFNFPMYWSLLFLQFVYHKKEKVRNI